MVPNRFSRRHIRRLKLHVKAWPNDNIFLDSIPEMEYCFFISVTNNYYATPSYKIVSLLTISSTKGNIKIKKA